MPGPGTPQNILLATDLSGRCDRALDRAALLALAWNARLVVVHALEPDYLTALGADRDTPSWRRNSARRATVAERQIREDLSGHEVPFEAIVEEGDPTETILKSAKERSCDFIVTGTARNETFGRFILGTTVEKLARKSPAPTLVVKRRARAPYRNIMVATDFSESSRRALQCAAALFPRAAIVVIHGYGDIAEFAATRASTDAGRQHAADTSARFVQDSGLPRESGDKIEILVESAPIETVVKAYAHDKDLDLLVVGGRGRSAVADLLLGSTAARLLSSAPCDVLVVRD